jgi:conjugative transfer pilus assembly protein TraH
MKQATHPSRILHLKRLCAALVFCLTPALCSAGILGDMTQMFMSNSTDPGTFSTRDRAGVFGGSFQVRIPTTHINLVSFDPPRFDAGCGGVDLYGGSFSFINSQQLVQIFRQVAANAVGLAFKAAVNAISPNLGGLMTEFQTVLQHLNGLAKNSCHLAGLLVDKGEQALGMSVDADGSTGSQKTGLFSDSIDALNGYLKDADKYLVNAAKVNPKAGNATYKAVLNSGASAMLGIAGLANVDGSVDDATNPNSLNNRVLVSLLGYQVSGMPCTNINANGTPDTQSPPAGSTLSNVTCNGPATLTLHDIVEGGGLGSPRPSLPLRVYTCVDPVGTAVAGEIAQPCTKLRLDKLDYPGIRGSVNLALFGQVDSSLPPTQDSIVGWAGGQGTPVQALTQPQLALLHQSGIPLTALMSRARSPLMRRAIAQKLSEHMIVCVAASVGESLYKAANSVQLGGENNLSDEVKGRIQALRTDYLVQRQNCLNDRKVLEVIQEMNESMKLVSNHNR